MADTKKKPYFTYIIFAIYSLMLIWLVLFKLSFSFSDIGMLGGERSINLIPFYYDNDVGRFHFKEAIMNVIVFVPLGIYLRMLGISIKNSILIGLTSSLTFELIQLIFAIGSSDITDLITNTLGAALGILFYFLWTLIFKKKHVADTIINICAAFFVSVFSILALLLFFQNR